MVISSTLPYFYKCSVLTISDHTLLINCLIFKEYCYIHQIIPVIFHLILKKNDSPISKKNCCYLSKVILWIAVKSKTAYWDEWEFPMRPYFGKVEWIKLPLLCFFECHHLRNEKI